MKDAPLRHALEYQLFRAFERFLSRREPERVRELGAGIGRVGYRLLRSARRKAEKNLELIFPTLEPQARVAIGRACFEHFGAYFCETVAAARFSASQIEARFDIEGWEIVEELHRERRNFFLTTGHFGCWELALLPFALRLKPFAAVARPLDNPRLDAYLRALRGRFGVELIDKAGAAHRMLNAFRQGAHVAMLIDQHVRPSAGIRTGFLGQPAWTSPVLAILATRTNAPILPFFCRPLAGGRYLLRLGEPLRPIGKGPEAELELTQRCLAAVENEIRDRPELWLWMHRRWRDANAECVSALTKKAADQTE